MVRRFLIVGLGNPGKAYQGTRHNVGFAVLEFFAKKHGLEFHKQLKWKGSLAKGKVGDSDVVLLMPLTFMNLSGEAVGPAMQYLNVALPSLLVVVDDIAIPIGHIRMRADSSSGGHNGLKSIAEHLQTNAFARLRIGVGDRKEGDLASYVLGQFSEEEKQFVPEILGRAVQAIEIWLEKGLNHAMDFANRKNPSNPSNGE